MTNTMPSLSHLYRHMNANLRVDTLDVDTLMRSAAGTVPADRVEAVAETLAASPVHADLVRLLRALEPAAAALAREATLATALQHTHRGHGDRRAAAGARRDRRGWQLGALAACLIAGVTLWTSRPHPAPLADDASLAARGDVIFDASSADRVATASAQTDVIFRGNGSEDHPDRIFNGRLGKDS